MRREWLRSAVDSLSSSKPRTGRHLARFSTAAAVAATAATVLLSPTAATAATPTRPKFNDVTSTSGLPTFASNKYGGPVVADLDADGTYDLLLCNHVHARTRVLWGVANSTRYTGGESLLPTREDVHGISAGDFGGGAAGSGPARKHVLVSLGGSSRSGPPWGTNPRPPRLYEMRAGRKWVDVTGPWRLTRAWARGRTAKLADLNGDGRLDVVLFNSAVLVEWDNSPRQKVFLNVGLPGGRRTFQSKTPSGVGGVNAEGVFLVDLNNDGVADAVTFSLRLGVFLGRGDGTFRNVSDAWLRSLPDGLWTGVPQWGPMTSIAALDYNADSRFDLYITVKGSRDVLLRNTGSALVDATKGAGLAPPPGPVATTAHMAVTVADLNNDGHEDLILIPYASAAIPIYLNRGDGTFERTNANGMRNNAPQGRGDGAQAYDADGDGNVDVLLSQGDRNGPIFSVFRLFRNVTPASAARRWLAVVVGRSPRGGSASGARVVVTPVGARVDRRPRLRAVGGAGDVWSLSVLDTVHVGVGAALRARVRVVWTDGTAVNRGGVPTNGRVVVP